MKGTKPTPRHLDTSGNRYLFDQLKNPDTITFTPCATSRNGALIYGRFACASSTPTSKKLLSSARRVLGKQCTRIKTYFVGREALVLLRQGVRLTISDQSPPEFDLREELANSP